MCFGIYGNGMYYSETHQYHIYLKIYVAISMIQENNFNYANFGVKIDANGVIEDGFYSR